MRSFRSIGLKFIVLIYFAGAFLPYSVIAQTDPATEPTETSPASTAVETQLARPIVALRTEHYPLAKEVRGTLQSRMMREIARQAILLAAREELGLPTRDETLGEPMPSLVDQPLGLLDLKFRAYYDGRYEMNLVIGADEDQGIERREVWSHIGQLPTERSEIYLGLTQELTSHIPAIAAALSKAGFVAEESQTEVERQLPEVEELLRETNFVSQFAAVRAAHRAIQGKELSAKRFGILVRGYAHLSALTTHLWSTHTEAFAARSLLYAERMRSIPEGELLADHHLAYGMGLIGMHSTALLLLDKLGESIELESEENPGEKTTMPTAKPIVGGTPEWAQIVRPYCEFEHVKLREIAKNNSEFNELITFLLWEQHRAYQHGRWIYEKGLATMEVCPEAYSVYSVMANWSALGIKRIGARTGMQVFGSRLSTRVAQLDDLPSTIKQAGVGGGGLWSKIFGGSTSEDAYSKAPMRISKALIKQATETPAELDLSWAILGSLIAEEQFVQVANMMRVAQDGVERSYAGLVRSVLPLVMGHRYENYIQTYTVQERGVKEKYWEILAGMKVVDPRGNMHRMFRRLWSYHSTPEANDGQDLSWAAVFKPTSTLAGCIESAYDTGNYWQTRKARKEWRLVSTYFHDVSPRSPNAFVLGFLYTKDINMDKLADWEDEAGEDPVAWLSLGSMYYERWESKAAIRCYKRSLEISPSFAATEWLANSYFRDGQEELWAPTLESYLEFEDLGLAHGQIHDRIAKYYLEKRKWTEALPHAEAAAQTWSAWGLLLAGRVHEGLQNWEQSENWMAEASRNYPSYSSGIEWYMWCRRTGRGDLDSATEIAEAWLPLQRDSSSERYHVAVYYLLEKNPQEALEIFHELDRECNAAKKAFDKAWYLAHLAITARLVGEDDLRDETVNRLRQVAIGPVKKANEKLTPVVIGLCDLLQGEALNAQNLEDLQKALSDVGGFHQCNYSYFLGAALEEQARIDEATSFWRQAAFNGPFDYVNATLAGDRLVLEYGPQRGDLTDVEGKADEPTAKDTNVESNK